MKRIRAVAVLPTLFTLGNLVCGFFAIVVAARIEAPTMETELTPSTAAIAIQNPTRIAGQFVRTDTTHNIMLSSWLIFLAMVFDALDGHVARLARHTTDFGGQLDSLCDLVTFGIAPAFLLVKMCTRFTLAHSYAIWIIAAAFAACAAMRLARFNVERADEDKSTHAGFSGLPSPAAAAVIAGVALLFYSLRKNTGTMPYSHEIDLWVQRTLPFVAIGLAIMMVSRIPYPHVVNQFTRGQKSFAHVVALVFALGSVMLVPGIAVPLLAFSFAAAPPLVFLWRRLYLRETQHEPLF